MLVSEILRRKGSQVATVRPDATVDEVVATLAEHGVGALVVSVDGSSVGGIISERDIVRALHQHGHTTVDESAGDLMTRQVVTCDRTATVDQLMADMNNGRFRHVPVIEEGRLVGIVSIGDVVNARVRELETETHQLTNYISGY